MGEKGGGTVKIQYDFNTAGVLEIFLNERWCRTTAKEFRSFDGKRRISQPTEIELGKVDMPLTTYDYNGPVYLYDTNKEVTKSNTGKLITGEVWQQKMKVSQNRNS